MLDTIRKNVNKRKHILVHNDERTKFVATRIKGFKEYLDNLARTPELKEFKAFFIYGEPNFASFGMSEKLDLLWVDYDGKIIHIEEGFAMNKISPRIKGTKYIYILPQNSIKKNKILANDTLTHVYDRPKGGLQIGDFF